MTRILSFSFFLLLSFSFFSQKVSKDLAKLYVLRTSVGEGGDMKARVFIANQKEVTLSSGGVLEYSMKTEGEMKIVIQYENDTKKYFCKVNLKKGNNNYVCIKENNIEEVPYGYIANFLNKRKDQIIKKEEDLGGSSSQPQTDLDYSTVYIVNDGGRMFRGQAGSIYIADQSPFNIESGDVIAYRIFSEGEISVQARCNFVGTFYATLKVKRGNEYFLFLNDDKLKETTREEVLFLLLENPSKHTLREENIESAINPKTLKKPRGPEGQGTCFLISGEGYMITNFHCIENANDITIKGIDGDFTTKFGASLIASDPTNDLALLKINNKNIKFNPPVYQIRSSGVMQGEKVYAMGYPIASAMGEEIKITEGIISALSGLKKDISKFQISAAVNPGNSGGPLIDENGNLIGIIYAKSTIAESAGYAIKAGYLEAFLKNVETFNYPDLKNTIKDKPFTEKIKELKTFIFIVETGN